MKPRGSCSVCGVGVAVRDNGTASAHGYSAAKATKCAGSGRPAVAARRVLIADPDRAAADFVTGFTVWAMRAGSFGVYDVADLDAKSLRYWLRSKRNAETLAMRLLGHTK